MDFSSTNGTAPEMAGMSASGGQAQARPNAGKTPRVPGPKVRTMAQRIRIGESDIALHARPGHVVLSALSSPDWKRQLSDFMHR